MVKTETDYLTWLKDSFENSSYWKNLGMSFEYLRKGDSCVKLVVNEDVINNNGTLHGGAIASLLDVAISSTLRSIEQEMVTTVSLTTNFINPAASQKTVYATASLVSSKSRIRYVDAKIVDEDGLLIATGVGVFSKIVKK